MLHLIHPVSTCIWPLIFQVDSVCMSEVSLLRDPAGQSKRTASIVASSTCCTWEACFKGHFLVWQREFGHLKVKTTQDGICLFWQAQMGTDYRVEFSGAHRSWQLEVVGNGTPQTILMPSEIGGPEVAILVLFFLLAIRWPFSGCQIFKDEQVVHLFGLDGSPLSIHWMFGDQNSSPWSQIKATSCRAWRMEDWKSCEQSDKVNF